MVADKRKEFKTSDYGASGDGKTCCTGAIQAAIDAAGAADGGVVTFTGGVYLTGALFLKSKVELRIDAGVELRGIQDESAYPEIRSRVAGIEMNWPGGLINILNQSNVKISGSGIINGQGEFWWHKYWGEDRLGGMRGDYTARGLRWAVDYDCKRPRNVIVYHSTQVVLEQFTSIRSPFWNIHICYSDQVHIKGLIIKDNQGPSTDGIDIDSSAGVLVEDCDIDCNDDNICLKSGRDSDGLRVNKVTENIVIRHCELGRGGGITLGSETSGGIRNVEIRAIRAKGTDNGLRIKSARTRGGVIENITVDRLELVDVLHPFSFQLDWNPSYSYADLPEELQLTAPEHWRILAQPVTPPELGIPEVRDLYISNVTASCRSKSLSAATAAEGTSSKAFEVYAFPQKPIRRIQLKNVLIEADLAGEIVNAVDWELENVKVRTAAGEAVERENCRNVPEVGTEQI